MSSQPRPTEKKQTARALAALATLAFGVPLACFDTAPDVGRDWLAASSDPESGDPDPESGDPSDCPDGCDDGDACTEDNCVDGVCENPPKDCNPGDSCKNWGCDPASGCWEEEIDCDDGNACTLNDRCEDGVCVREDKDCDDGLGCTTDWCDRDSGTCHNESCECNDPPPEDYEIGFSLSTGDISLPSPELPCPQPFGGSVGASFAISGSLYKEESNCNNDCTSKAEGSIAGSVTGEMCKSSETFALTAKGKTQEKRCSYCSGSDRVCENSISCGLTEGSGGVSFTKTRFWGFKGGDEDDDHPVSWSFQCGIEGSVTGAVDFNGKLEGGNDCPTTDDATCMEGPDCYNCNTGNITLTGGAGLSGGCRVTVSIFGFSFSVGTPQAYANLDVSAGAGAQWGDECTDELCATGSVTLEAGLDYSTCVGLLWYSHNVDFHVQTGGTCERGCGTQPACTPKNRAYIRVTEGNGC